MTSESGKNASGQEAFGSKMPETPVVESPAASAADVMSAAVGAGTKVASEVDKAGTSAPPTAKGEGGDLCTTVLQPAPGPQVVMEEGTRSEDDQHRCLYVGTPREAEAIADRRGMGEFKEASRTIGCVLSVRILVTPFEFPAFGCSVHEVSWYVFFVCDEVSC
jgi:hypothetical protein